MPDIFHFMICTQVYQDFMLFKSYYMSYYFVLVYYLVGDNVKIMFFPQIRRRGNKSTEVRFKLEVHL